MPDECRDLQKYNMTLSLHNSNELTYLLPGGQIQDI